MTDNFKEKLKKILLRYPKPKGIALSYGTSGFRARADTLPWIMVRVGLLAALRSRVKQGPFSMSNEVQSIGNLSFSLCRCDDYRLT